MKAIVILLLILPMAFAQLDWSVTDLRCGNEKLDEFELCEEGVEKNYCDDMAAILGIDTACDTQHCTCLPRVNRAFCGNDKREGVELCDGTAEDLCGEFGNITGLSLVCNPDTCGCEIAESVPEDYNPLVVEELINKSQEASVCGDKKVERNEDCDPPNTLCTTGAGDAGVCTEDCECVLPSALDEPEEQEEPVEQNETPVESEEAEVAEEPEQNDTAEREDTEEPGFFGRLWAWVVALFS